MSSVEVDRQGAGGVPTGDLEIPEELSRRKLHTRLLLLAGLVLAVVARELRRNAATRGGKLEYRASVAQWRAELMARRPKTAKLATNAELREYVQEWLSGQVRRPDGTVLQGQALGQGLAGFVECQPEGMGSQRSGG
jgi:hypothetical protein